MPLRNSVCNSVCPGGGGQTNWTSCVKTKPLSVPCLKVEDITCTALQERANIHGLNDALAGHMDHVKALCAKAASHIDPKTYHEALRTLEIQAQQLRCMYEQEVAKLRQRLDQVNKDRGCLVSKAGANSSLASSLQARLTAEEETNQKAHADLAQLQALLAQREKELTELRACLDARDRELSQLRPRANQLCCEVKELRTRLACENHSRVVAEERSKELSNQFTFDRSAACEANKDLVDRLKAANDVIACLEQKICVLTEWAGRQTDTRGMLRSLRDGTCQQLSKYKREAEQALDCVIQAMKQQRDADGRNNAELIRDKATLQECIRGLQAESAEFQAKLAACCQEKACLEAAFEKEKACAKGRIQDLEQKLREVTDLVAAKVKDATLAREAQVALNTEISTYRTLIENQQDQLANCAPCVPCKPRVAVARPLPDVCVEPMKPWCDRADMPSGCKPCDNTPPRGPYKVAPRPESTYHKQGDYGFPRCAPQRINCSPPQPLKCQPFRCPKGKPLKDCDCPRPMNFATTYMTSYYNNPAGLSRPKTAGCCRR